MSIRRCSHSLRWIKQKIWSCNWIIHIGFLTWKDYLTAYQSDFCVTCPSRQRFNSNHCAKTLCATFSCVILTRAIHFDIFRLCFLTLVRHENVRTLTHNVTKSILVVRTSSRLSSVFTTGKTLWSRQFSFASKSTWLEHKLKAKNGHKYSCPPTTSQCIPIDSCKYRKLKNTTQITESFDAFVGKTSEKSNWPKVWLMFANLCNKIRMIPKMKLPNSSW